MSFLDSLLQDKESNDLNEPARRDLGHHSLLDTL